MHSFLALAASEAGRASEGVSEGWGVKRRAPKTKRRAPETKRRTTEAKRRTTSESWRVKRGFSNWRVRRSSQAEVEPQSQTFARVGTGPLAVALAERRTEVDTGSFAIALAETRGTVEGTLALALPKRGNANGRSFAFALALAPRGVGVAWRSRCRGKAPAAANGRGKAHASNGRGKRHSDDRGGRAAAFQVGEEEEGQQGLLLATTYPSALVVTPVALKFFLAIVLGSEQRAQRVHVKRLTTNHITKLQ